MAESEEDYTPHERALQLFEEQKVGELKDYISEIFSPEAIQFIEYGTICDTHNTTIEEANNMISMGIKESSDSMEAFNIITLFIPRKPPLGSSAQLKQIGFRLDAYNFYTNEAGQWFIGYPEPPKDTKSQFVKSTFDDIVNFVTELTFDENYEFEGVSKICNDQVFTQFMEFAEFLDFIARDFGADQKGVSHAPTYRRFGIDRRAILPLVSDLGIDISNIKNLEDNDEIVDLVLQTSPKMNMFRFHEITFTFGGIVYTIYKNYGVKHSWVIEYGTQRHVKNLSGMRVYLKTIKDTDMGLGKFSEIWEDVKEENGDFVQSFKDIFSTWVANMEVESFDPANDIRMSDDPLEIFGFEITTLGKLVDHNILLANCADQRYIRWCVMEAHGYKVWINAQCDTVYLQDTKTKKINEFASADDLGSVLRAVFAQRTGTY